MITTLENLTEEVRKNRLKNLAKNIVKYQNFKTSIIINKIDNAGYSRPSLFSYINSGIAYIKNGNKNKKAGNIYEYIDEAIKNCVQPLTPAYNECRLTLKRRPQIKKDTILPVQNVLNKLNEKIKPQAKIAVQLNNNLSIVNDEKEAIGFNKCLEFLGKQAGKIVKVVIEEVNE